ncbi:MAG: alpha/beta hydrolase, partial [Candidatus Eremiobacteraeota bacterium]|nr:alpha/beta hydrolase [Candidatus Eremiobacteraeota bacterium]
EDVLLDLRPSLAKATLPILEIAPFDATLDTKPPMSLASPAIKQQYYQSIVANAPNAHVVVIPNSRHFIMYDQPAALHTQLASFISSLPPM